MGAEAVVVAVAELGDERAQEAAEGRIKGFYNLVILKQIIAAQSQKYELIPESFFGQFPIRDLCQFL